MLEGRDMSHWLPEIDIAIFGEPRVFLDGMTGYCQPKRIQSCLRPLPRFGEVSSDRSEQAALETEIYNRAPKL